MPACEITIEKIDFEEPVHIVRITGALDAYSFPDFEVKVRGIFDKNGRNIILDFGKLEYISSAGLGALMGFAKIARQNKGDLIILKPTPKIGSIIDVLGLSKFIKVFWDEKTALNLFVSKAG
ncbi:MAG: STAS domain-containing protein [bacterium]|nr:STAS domain-containing protein [bacterium]